jgi:hypothetical protein
MVDVMRNSWLVCCLWLFILIFSVNSSVYGQSNLQTICGKIFDKDSEKALQSVSVLVKNTSRRYEVLSDTKGFFQLSGVPVGTYTILVRYIGYKTVTVNGIDLNENNTPFIQVALEKEVKEIRKVIPRYERTNDVAISDVLIGAIASQNKSYGLDNCGPLDRTAGIETVPGAYRVDQYGESFSFGAVSPVYNNSNLGGVLNVATPFLDGLQTENILIGSDKRIFKGHNVYSSMQPFHANSTMGSSSDVVFIPGYFRANEVSLGANTDGVSLTGQGGLRSYQRLARSSYHFSYDYFNSDIFSQKMIRNTNLPTSHDFNLTIQIPTLKYGTFTAWTKAGMRKREVNALDSLYIPWNVQPYSELEDDKKAMAIGTQHVIHFMDDRLTVKNSIGGMLQQNNGNEKNSRQLQYRRKYDLKQQQLAWKSKVMFKPSENHMFYLGGAYSRYKLGLDDRIWKAGVVKDLYQSDSFKVTEWNISLGYLLRISNSLSTFVGGQYVANNVTKDPYWNANVALKVEVTPNIHFKIGAAKGKTTKPWALYDRVQKKESPEKDPVLYRDLSNESYTTFQARLDMNLGNQIYWLIDGDYKIMKDLWVDSKPTSFAFLNWGSNPFQTLPNEMSANGKGKVLRISSSVEKAWGQNTFFRISGAYYKTEVTTTDDLTRPLAWDPKYVLTSTLGGRIDLSTSSHFTGAVHIRMLGVKDLFDVDVEESKRQMTTVYKSDEDYQVQLKTPLMIGANVNWFYNSRKFGHQISVNFENMTDATFGGYQYWSFAKGEVVVPKSIGLYGRISYVLHLNFERSKKIKKSWF